jgi:nitrate/TMAO reductase-like tetraheme cytochrome c subunit
MNHPEEGHAPRPASKSKSSGFVGLGITSLAVFLGGTLSLGGLNTTMDWTNREEFCISCHEMADNPLREYQQTLHDKNRVGVHAVCADCHVPKEWGPKILAKIRATKDVYHHLLGTIDTREKYAARRLQMAQVVWDSMRADDSKACRNCHRVSAMDFQEQQGRAARKHRQLAERGQTCIDCHKGVAHELPAGYEETDL